MRSYINKAKAIKNITLILLFMLIFTVIPFNKSQATLQANPNTQYTTTDWATNWIKTIREMEKTGGAMGLDEIMNNDLTSTTNNGIDVHMIKSTEYGATAILSASGYGNPDTLQNSAVKTTTGNKTGIYYNGTSWENVAAGTSVDSGNNKQGTFKISYNYAQTLNYNSKYYDISYTEDTSSEKIGDALNSCSRWHGATYNEWITPAYSMDQCYMLRGNGGIFSYSYMQRRSIDNYEMKNWAPYYTHAIAVCGAGM